MNHTILHTSANATSPALSECTTVNDTDDTRELGIEFGALIGDVEDESCPLFHETRLTRYGDRERGSFDGHVLLRDVLSPEQERAYEDVESARQAVFNVVADDASAEKSTATAAGMLPAMTARLR